MAFGVPLTEAEKEQIMAMHASGMSYSAIGKAIGLSKSAVCSRIKKYKSESPDSWEEIRDNVRKKIVEDTWKSVETLTKILNKRLDIILKHEDNLDKILTTIVKSEEINEQTKKQIIKLINDNVSPKLVEITTAMGTAWDKADKSQSAVDESEESGVVIMPPIEPLEPPKEEEE